MEYGWLKAYRQARLIRDTWGLLQPGSDDGRVAGLGRAPAGTRNDRAVTDQQMLQCPSTESRRSIWPLFPNSIVTDDDALGLLRVQSRSVKFIEMSTLPSRRPPPNNASLMSRHQSPSSTGHACHSATALLFPCQHMRLSGLATRSSLLSWARPFSLPRRASLAGPLRINMSNILSPVRRSVFAGCLF